MLEESPRSCFSFKDQLVPAAKNLIVGSTEAIRPDSERNQNRPGRFLDRYSKLKGIRNGTMKKVTQSPALRSWSVIWNAQPRPSELRWSTKSRWRSDTWVALGSWQALKWKHQAECDEGLTFNLGPAFYNQGLASLWQPIPSLSLLLALTISHIFMNKIRNSWCIEFGEI